MKNIAVDHMIHKVKVRKLIIKVNNGKAAEPLRLVSEMVKSTVEAGIDTITDWWLEPCKRGYFSGGEA